MSVETLEGGADSLVSKIDQQFIAQTKPCHIVLLCVGKQLYSRNAVQYASSNSNQSIFLLRDSQVVHDFHHLQ